MTDQRDLAKEVETIAAQVKLGWPNMYHFVHAQAKMDIGILLDHIASQSRELEELRRPVGQSDQVEAIRRRLNCYGGQELEDLESLLSALDQAQRDLLESQREVARCVGTHHAWQVETDRVKAERDEARGKCARLEQQQLGAKALFERIERLKGANEQLISAIERLRSAGYLGKKWPTYLDLALAAADGQQKVTQCDPPCPVDLCQQWSAQGMCQHPDRYQAPSGTEAHQEPKP